jgi:hypothetical protein
MIILGEKFNDFLYLYLGIAIMIISPWLSYYIIYKLYKDKI